MVSLNIDARGLVRRTSVAKEVGFLLAFFCLTAIVGVAACYNLMLDNERRERTLAAATSSRFLAQAFDADADKISVGKQPDRDSLIRRIDRFQQVLSVLRDGGELNGVAVSKLPQAAMRILEESQIVWDELLSALNRMTKSSNSRPESASASIQVLAPILSDSANRVVVSIQDSNRRENRSMAWMLSGVCAVDFCLLVLGVWLTRQRLTSPIKSISRAAQHYHSGDFTHKIEIASNNEFGELAEVLNKMSAMASSSLARMEQSRVSAQDAATLERERRQVMEMIVSDRPLDAVLSLLATCVEHQCPGTMCSASRVEHGQLRYFPSPCMPREFVDDLDGSPISPQAGGCGAAAYWGQMVLSTDISTDSGWKSRADLARRHGIAGALCIPVVSGSKTVLGTLAIYHSEANVLNASIATAVESWAHLAAMAIEHKQLSEQLSFAAYHDVLTGLPNRLLYYDRLEQAIHLARRRAECLGLLYIDLDEFKQVNDQHGHAKGDALLQQVAARIRSRIRQTDTLARLGGDEFAVILTAIHGSQEAETLAQKIAGAMAPPFDLDGVTLTATASIGVSVFPLDGQDVAVLERKADSAMYEVKISTHKGSSRYASSRGPAVCAGGASNRDRGSQLEPPRAGAPSRSGRSSESTCKGS